MKRLRTLLLLGLSIFALTLTLVQGAAAAEPVALQIDAAHRATVASGFIANERISAWYNLPDGTAVYFDQTGALDDGSLNWLIDPTAWATIPTNAVNFVVAGQESGVEAIYTFSQPTATTPAPAPTPLALTIGDDGHATAGAGFTPGEEVGVWYNLPDGTAVSFTLTSGTDAGTLDWMIDQTDWATIPTDAVNLVAQGQESGTLAIYTFVR